MTHGLLVTRPAVTFLAAEHHCRSTSTEFYCLVTEAGVRKQLAEGRSEQRSNTAVTTVITAGRGKFHGNTVGTVNMIR